MGEGLIDQGVDSLLSAVGDLDSIAITQADIFVDAAIGKVLAASSNGFTRYVQMLMKLKADIATVRNGIAHSSRDIEALAVRIDNAGNQ